MYQYHLTQLRCPNRVRLCHEPMHRLTIGIWSVATLVDSALYPLHSMRFSLELVDQEQISLLERSVNSNHEKKIRIEGLFFGGNSKKRHSKLTFSEFPFELLAKDRLFGDMVRLVPICCIRNGCCTKMVRDAAKLAIWTAWRLAAANCSCCWMFPLDFECCKNCGFAEYKPIACWAWASRFSVNSGACTFSLFGNVMPSDLTSTVKQKKRPQIKNRRQKQSKSFIWSIEKSMEKKSCFL